MNPQLILFGIEAGIRLGRHFNQVLIERAIEKALHFPIGEIFGDTIEDDAIEYFRDLHPELIEEGGEFADLVKDGQPRRERMVDAYRKIAGVNGQLSTAGHRPTREAALIVKDLEALSQFSASGTPGRLQRTARLLIGLGVQFFQSQPQLLAGDSSSRRILQSFVGNLDPESFSEETESNLLGTLFLASLRTLQGEAALLSDNERVQALVGGVTRALLDDYEAVATSSAAANLRRKDFLKRIAVSSFRGGASAFTEHSELFLRSDGGGHDMVRQTLRQVLAGLKGHEHRFTGETMELVFRSALRAAAEYPDFLGDRDLLRDLIHDALEALAKRNAQTFSDKAGAVLLGVLRAVEEHGNDLLSQTAGGDRTRLLALGISAIGASLSSRLAGSGDVKSLLSKSQLVDLSRIALEQVAKDPEVLLRSDGEQAERTLLAQVIGSAARALGESPSQLVTGEGFLRLVEVATDTALRNADRLVDLDTATTRTNRLFVISQAVVKGFVDSKESDARGLLTKAVFLDLMKGVLGAVSANLDGLVADPEARFVSTSIAHAVELANGDLQGRINGEVLPRLVERILVAVLWDGLDLNEPRSVRQHAERMLRDIALA